MTRQIIRKFSRAAMAAGLLGTAGCMMEVGDSAVGVSKSALNTTLTFAQDDTTGALTSDEHCLLPSPEGTTLHGRQVRIERADGHTGLCTVMGESPDSKAYMKSGGLNKRFGRSLDAGVGDEVSEVTVIDTCPSGDPECAGIADSVASIGETYGMDAGAPVINEFVATHSIYSKVAYTAPHSAIEDGTAQQLETIRGEETSRTGYPRNAYWAVGYKTGAGLNSYEHYHITSSDISENSFAGLMSLFDLPSLIYAVSFHGCADETCGANGVYVGGGIEPAFRRGVADLLRGEAEREGESISVSASPPAGLAGEDADNFINRLIPDNSDPDNNGRGLQIESSKTLRKLKETRDLVATSVKESIDCVRETEDVFINLDDSLTTRVSDAWSTANYVGGSEECDGYMVRFNFSNTNPMTDVEFLAELSSSVGCSSGARVYLDVYEQADDANWERVGGGWREPFSLNGSCLYNIDLYYEQAKVDIPAGVTRFRVAARAYSAAGQHLPVKVIVTRP